MCAAKKILMLDDSEFEFKIFQKKVTKFLQKELDVTYAPDLGKALEKIEQEPYELVLVDRVRPDVVDCSHFEAHLALLKETHFQKWRKHLEVRIYSEYYFPEPPSCPTLSKTARIADVVELDFIGAGV
jgi:DNA-binding NtrC family response regulator